MVALDSYSVLMGILRFCPKKDIPADSQAIQKALFRLSKLFPGLLCSDLFDDEGRSIELEIDLETIMMAGMLGILGSHLETFRISTKMTKEFDFRMSHLFSHKQMKDLKRMGIMLPSLLKKNESSRYKRLIRQ